VTRLIADAGDVPGRSDLNVAALTRVRREEIFAGLRHNVFVETDRLFAVLMTIQWVFGVLAAQWISPRAWAGTTSQVHIHVWAAFFLGGAISSFPIGLVLLRPGRTSTRHAIALGQMLFGALLIHLTGGRIETHFHVFGSLAFLAFYRDWRVLATATLVVVADHAVRGVLFPESIYGVLTPGAWRFLEHAAWVVFEDVVLVTGCVRGTQELARIAERTAEFERSQERYNAVVEQSAEGILVFDAATRKVVEFNRAFARRAGAPPEVLHGLVLDKALVGGDSDVSLEAEVYELLRSGKPVVSDRTLRGLDGKHIDVSCSMSPTTYAGRPAVCAVIRDMSERNRIQAELADARDAAIESARLKSEFLANMSHEIRTPMNGVVGMAGLLLETALTQQQREFTETIQTSADSLLTVINDILDFSKVESGKLQFEVLDFDLRQVLESTLDLMAERAFAKKLELVLIVDADVPTALQGDPGRLRQILTNLISNALKFTERGEVVVQASIQHVAAEGSVIRFAVRDTGIGIPEEANGRLFEAFMQADGSTTRKHGGTGLGLAICKRLVDLMGGAIGFNSVVGTGTTFWFTARFAAQPASALVPTLTVTALADHRALIVDDNATNRTILHHQLTNWCLDNQMVGDAEQALVALREATACGRPFSLAVLDRQMPAMDGVELARAIKADRSIAAILLVMVTSLGDLGDERELKQAGIEECVTKPIKQAQLRDCLARVLSPQTTEIPEPRATKPSEMTPIRARVLLAEDNTINQRVALLQLRRLGCTADAVANGAEAVGALRHIPYDVVLMDCQMPEMDGYQATQIIRTTPSHFQYVPIIAMTAHALAGDREKCIEIGMNDYVSKPVKTAELHAALVRWVGTARDGPEPAAHA
jgi:two-component system sensor histidine kinase/response regulator